jgi:hypothetical protein
VAAYASNRGYWLDESSLAANIEEGGVLSIFESLGASQLVPPGFLIVERALAKSLGTSRLVLRLVPLASGLAALFLFAVLARRIFQGWTATLVLALFACSDELVYFSTELKPYSTDVAAAVAVTLAATLLGEKPLTFARWLAWSALGGCLVWFSFPVAFVLSVAGPVVVFRALGRHQYRQAAALALAPLLWLLSFAVVLASARAQLGGHPGMWSFWAFAFPPSLGSDPAWIPRRLLYLFVNPGDFHGPFDPRIAALPAILLATTGAISLGRRDPASLCLVGGPIVPTLLAAAFRAYPFHGRCLLFLLPGLFVLLAEGANRASRLAPALPLRFMLSAILLAPPLARDLYHLVEPRDRLVFNPLGDRRPHNVSPDMFNLKP